MSRKRRKPTVATPPSPAPRFPPELLGLLVLLVLLRALYLHQFRERTPYDEHPLVDAAYYHDWARSVVDGRGYGDEPFYMAPLYPYVLAALYAVAGPTPGVAHVPQVALGVASALLVYLLARRLASRAAAAAAMLLVGLYGPLVYLETKLLTETLAVFLGLLGILLLGDARRRPTPSRHLAAGVVLGLAALCRPTALLTVAMIVAWLGWSAVRQRQEVASHARCLLALLGGVALAILPVTTRNLLVGHDAVLITTNAGIVFAQSNSASSLGVWEPVEGFSGSIQRQQREERARAAEAVGHPVTPSEASRYWLGIGASFAREKPGAFARLLLRKLLWTLHAAEPACCYDVRFEASLVPVLRWLAVPFPLVAGLSLIGLRSLARSRGSTRREELALVVISASSTLASLLVFSVSSRFRAPAVPPLAILAGAGLVDLLRAARSRDLRALAIMAALVAPVGLVSAVPFPFPAITAESPANLGLCYVALGEHERARGPLEEALRMSPSCTSAQFGLAWIADKSGDLSEAADRYRRVLELDGANADMHDRLGTVLLKAGRSEEAAAAYGEAVRLNGSFAQARFNLGVALHTLGRTEAALVQYEAAIALRADYANAHYNAAVVLEGQGRRAAAIAAYREAVRHKPRVGAWHLALARALEADGQHAEAERERLLARQLGTDRP